MSAQPIDAARLLLEEFEAYRQRVQSGSVTTHDEVRIEATFGYTRMILGDLRVPEILTTPRPEIIKDADRINRRK